VKLSARLAKPGLKPHSSAGSPDTASTRMINTTPDPAMLLNRTGPGIAKVDTRQPATLGQTRLAAVPQRPARGLSAGSGRGRQDTPRNRARPHRRAPPPQRAHGPRRQAFQAALKAARLDNTVEAEMRRLANVELLILDDFTLQPLDATKTTDFDD